MVGIENLFTENLMDFQCKNGAAIEKKNNKKHRFLTVLCFAKTIYFSRGNARKFIAAPINLRSYQPEQNIILPHHL